MKYGISLSFLFVLLFFSFPVFADRSVDDKLIRLIQDAQIARDAQDYGDAKNLLERARRLNSSYPEIYRVLGSVYERQHKPKEAEQYYLKWAAFAPGYFLPYQWLGTLFYEQGDYKKSNHYFARAKSLNPTSSFILSYRCHNFVKLGRWHEAVEECSQSIRVDPHYKYAYGERSKAYRALGQSEKAAQDSKMHHGAGGQSAKPYDNVETFLRDVYRDVFEDHLFFVFGLLCLFPILIFLGSRRSRNVDRV